tara:strand:+ start:990 stop:1214 length:225 start_codon:yes stop_codon:yes gene_type:complete
MMKKLIPIFITLLAFGFAQASPLQSSKEIKEKVLLAKLDQNNKVFVNASDEMQQQRRRRSKMKRQARRNKRVEK